MTGTGNGVEVTKGKSWCLPEGGAAKRMIVNFLQAVFITCKFSYLGGGVMQRGHFFVCLIN